MFRRFFSLLRNCRLSDLSKMGGLREKSCMQIRPRSCADLVLPQQARVPGQPLSRRAGRLLLRPADRSQPKSPPGRGNAPVPPEQLEPGVQQLPQPRPLLRARGRRARRTERVPPRLRALGGGIPHEPAVEALHHAKQMMDEASEEVSPLIVRLMKGFDEKSLEKAARVMLGEAEEDFGLCGKERRKTQKLGRKGNQQEPVSWAPTAKGARGETSERRPGFQDPGVCLSPKAGSERRGSRKLDVQFSPRRGVGSPNSPVYRRAESFFSSEADSESSGTQDSESQDEVSADIDVHAGSFGRRTRGEPGAEGFGFERDGRSPARADDKPMGSRTCGEGTRSSVGGGEDGGFGANRPGGARDACRHAAAGIGSRGKVARSLEPSEEVAVS
jgi:hypothetical protein